MWNLYEAVRQKAVDPEKLYYEVLLRPCHGFMCGQNPVRGLTLPPLRFLPYASSPVQVDGTKFWNQIASAQNGGAQQQSSKAAY